MGALKRELLPREEYYRPSRARELRRKAQRLEHLRGLTGATMVGAGSLAGVTLVGFLSFYLHLPVFLLLGLLFLTWLVFGLLRLRDGLPFQARRLRQQAEQLEAEHEAQALAPGIIDPKSRAPR